MPKNSFGLCIVYNEDQLEHFYKLIVKGGTLIA